MADLLRSYAEESFLSQTELARRSGISQSQISKLFRGERHLTVAQFGAICIALNVPFLAIMALAAEAVGSDEGTQGDTKS